MQEPQLRIWLVIELFYEFYGRSLVKLIENRHGKICFRKEQKSACNRKHLRNATNDKIIRWKYVLVFIHALFTRGLLVVDFC